MKNVYLLGATGSIGEQTIDIIQEFPEVFNLIAISGHSNLEKIIEIGSKFNLELIAVKDESDTSVIKDVFPNAKIVFGANGLSELATYNKDDKEGILINALVGMVGLKPTIDAIKIDRDILLANKETLVVGGHLIKELLKTHPIKLYPIDSEHNAIWQILQGEDTNTIKQLIITASGGSFRDLSRDELKNVTLKEALNHPNWSMGKKITIDSATMINKGFEIIEAAYLFDIDIDKIKPIIQADSIIHSMVEYIDNSIVAQMASPDMKLPIIYAMFYPKRVNSVIEPLDFNKISNLSFKEVDYKRYPLLQLAIECFKKGGSNRTVLNAANEAAVSLFLNQKISFLDIESIVKNAIDNHKTVIEPSLEEIYKIDQLTKESIFTRYNK
ncbi:MAG: 1-deoxy-D-xylulose-5-phosphate reductoisomerase [Tenericutes bacterium]|nr:1-deoxy-D-xylulose-5-phosphate reductoisomerase [Mycoplasmatota bacterium]